MSEEKKKEKDPRPRGYQRQPFCAALQGRRGAGKTTIVVNLLVDVYRKRFDIIIIMSKTIHLQRKVWERLYGKGILIVGGLDMRVLKALKDFMETQDEDKEALIIIDDIGLQARIWADKRSQKDKVTKAELEDELTNIATAGRHHGISTIYLCQVWTMLSTEYRKQLDWLGIITATFGEQDMIYREIAADEFDRDMESFRIYHKVHTGKTWDVKVVNGKKEKVLKQIKMYFIFNEDGQFKMWPPSPLTFRNSQQQDGDAGQMGGP